MKLVFALLCALGAASAAAQVRTIPQEAQVGILRHLESMVVEIDGKARALAPGAQIRDADNRIVVPSSLVERSLVRYVLDGSGMVFRVWILTPAEQAALPPLPYPK